MAAWLVEAGATTPRDVVSLLDSSPLVLQLAHEAAKAEGVRLMEWAALLNTCKQLGAAPR